MLNKKCIFICSQNICICE